jgi:purine-cytosine permease-like protein
MRGFALLAALLLVIAAATTGVTALFEEQAGLTDWSDDGAYCARIRRAALPRAFRRCLLICLAHQHCFLLAMSRFLHCVLQAFVTCG